MNNFSVILFLNLPLQRIPLSLKLIYDILLVDLVPF